MTNASSLEATICFYSSIQVLVDRATRVATSASCSEVVALGPTTINAAAAPSAAHAFAMVVLSCRARASTASPILTPPKPLMPSLRLTFCLLWVAVTLAGSSSRPYRCSFTRRCPP